MSHTWCRGIWTPEMGTERMGFAVRAAAACVHSRQEAAYPTAAAVELGQHLLLGIVPILSVPISGVQRSLERKRVAKSCPD
eukprot:9499047-Pyramimonas_sp.AAC.1